MSVVKPFLAQIRGVVCIIEGAEGGGGGVVVAKGPSPREAYRLRDVSCVDCVEAVQKSD